MNPEANISLDTFATLVRAETWGENQDIAPFRPLLLTYAALWHPIWWRESLEEYKLVMNTYSQDYKDKLKWAWNDVQRARPSIPWRVAFLWRRLERAESREGLNVMTDAVYADRASTMWMHRLTFVKGRAWDDLPLFFPAR
jgi:hypothetical protein